jgi:DNA-binding XRE family transcriptional regulator
MPNPALDFTKVEALRKHMLLNTTQMSKFLGVSRVTYSGWTKGKPIRKGNDAKVRIALRKMFVVIESHQWPMPEVIGMVPKDRFDTLLEMTKEEE